MQQQGYIRDINPRGQIVIPHKMRKILKIKKGSVCKVTMGKDSIIIKLIKT